MFFHLSTVIINSFLKNKLPASAWALLKPCQAGGRLHQDGTVTPQLILAAARERSCHSWRRPFTAAYEGPFQQQVPIQLGAARESILVPQGCAAAMLHPWSPPATLTAGALLISTSCCWGQRLAGWRCQHLY